MSFCAAAVAPGETAHVKLVLVAQTDFAPDLQHCRDRFLVQSLPILPGQQPDSTAFKAQKFKVQDHKLRVSIVSPLPLCMTVHTLFRHPEKLPLHTTSSAVAPTHE